MHVTCMLHVCYMHVTCMLHACNMYVTCMLQACYMYVTCLLHVCYMYVTCMLHACYMYVVHAICEVDMNDCDMIDVVCVYNNQLSHPDHMIYIDNFLCYLAFWYY